VEDSSLGANKIQAIATYLYDSVLPWLRTTESIYQAYANLPFKTLEFQCYQVELDLARFSAHTRAEQLSPPARVYVHARVHARVYVHAPVISMQVLRLRLALWNW